MKHTGLLKGKYSSISDFILKLFMLTDIFIVLRRAHLANIAKICDRSARYKIYIK